MKDERQKILTKLMHTPILSFNKLWDKEGTSNSFAYHLKVLEEDNMVEKTHEGYKLTHEGKKYATYLEGDSGEKAKFPLVGVVIIIFNKEEDEVLMTKRTKEPFYGHWGFQGGKLKFDQYILECAKAEVKEESGLECDLELKGLFSSKTLNNDSLSYNHQLFIVKGTNPRGKLLKKTREGENKWFKLTDISNLKTFPNTPNSVEIVQGEGFRWIEADRIQDNDQFTDMKILRDTII